MNTKRYRKRKTSAVPMSAVRLRESHANRGTISRHRRKCYPLFESWDSIYNFKNLMESIMDWEDYSSIQEENVKQVGRLLQEVESRGSKEEVEQAARLVCEEVLSYVKNPSLYTNYFSKLVEQSKLVILDHIRLLTECDRISENYKLLEQKYNMKKLFIEACNYWGIDEAMNRLCDCMEAYNIPDFKTRFCVTVENALYGLSGLVQEYEIPQKALVEAIIDYHLVNDGCHDTYAYFQEVRDAIQESDFIPDVAEPYLQFLEAVRDNKRPSQEKLKEHYEDPAIQAIAEYDDYLTMQNSIEAFYEMGSFDDAKEWIAKLKISPIRSLNMVKEGIRTVLVTRRLEDIKDGVHNALSIAFYVAVIAGFATLGSIPTILGAITTFILREKMDKQYLRDAISEWKAHRYEVQRKLNTTKSAEQKRKLQAYLDEVDKNIELLTKEYEENRDRTADELERSRPVHQKNFKPEDPDDSFSITRSAEVDPTGRVTPASSLHPSNSLINAADRRVG